MLHPIIVLPTSYRIDVRPKDTIGTASTLQLRSLHAAIPIRPRPDHVPMTRIFRRSAASPVPGGELDDRITRVHGPTMTRWTSIARRATPWYATRRGAAHRRRRTTDAGPPAWTRSI